MPSYESTQVGYWKHPHLSYPVFMAFSIIGGVIGLDHLYLRSPMTALFKILSFFVLPFFWYMYDIFQATAEKEKFMTYGLTTPLITTSGIGAKMFKTDDERKGEEPPSPSPLYFIGYILLGIIPMGFDLFLVGDGRGGLAKLLISLIPILGWIYVAIWTVANYFEILFSPETIFEQGVTHFKTPFVDERFYSDKLGKGIPTDPNKKMSFGDLMRAIWADIKEYFLGSKKEKKEGEETHGFFSAIFSRIKDYLQNKVIAKSPTLQKAVGAAEKVGEVATKVGTEVVGTAIDTGSQVLALANPVAVAETAGKATTIITEAFEEKLPKEKVAFSPQQVRQGGGGIVENGSATLALVGMLVIVCSLSLGKYIYTKFHTAAEKKADAEVPPTRKEFVAVREGPSDEPPTVAVAAKI